MQLVCPPGGERAGVPHCLLARSTSRHTDASVHARRTSAHASHAEDNDSNLFQGLGFMVCVYLFFRNVAQGSDDTVPSVQAYLRV